MNLQIHLFAACRQVADRDHVTVQLPDGATLAELRAALLQQVPALKPWMQHVRFAVNTEYVEESRQLQPEDEIALIPPVSGG